MDEYDEIYWNRDSRTGLLPSVTWSPVVVAFRAITFAALALGWIHLIQTTRPNIVLVIIMAVGAFLAIIVGWRRAGKLILRIKAAGFFVVESTIVAFYSMTIAGGSQPSSESEGQFDGIIESMFIVSALPIVLFVLVFMLRAWTWSAHDRLIARSRRR